MEFVLLEMLKRNNCKMNKILSEIRANNVKKLNLCCMIWTGIMPGLNICTLRVIPSGIKRLF